MGGGGRAPRGDRPRWGRAGSARGWGSACGVGRGGRRGLRSSGFAERGEVSLHSTVRDLSHLRCEAPGSPLCPAPCQEPFRCRLFPGAASREAPAAVCRQPPLSRSESGRAAAGGCETDVTFLLKNVRRNFSPLRPGLLAHPGGARSVTCAGRSAALLALSRFCLCRRCPARAALRYGRGLRLRDREAPGGPRAAPGARLRRRGRTCALGGPR